ncbi:MAG TPA: hypothetical protein VMT91_14850 [Anaerolineales bacterium]|nr:hypothetical protein [Anaerolineales bacterium]
MSAIPSAALCVALSEDLITKMFGLMMDDMVVEFEQANPVGNPDGLELKSALVKVRPSILDATHGPLRAPALEFEPALGRIHLHELDLKWEKLDLALSLQLKEKDIKLFGKTLRIFQGSPKLGIVLPLAKYIRHSEVDIHLEPEVRHIPPEIKDGQPIPATEGWAIGFREAMVQFDVFDLEAIFEDVVVGALKVALNDALFGRDSTLVDILIDAHLANFFFRLQYRNLTPAQRRDKACQLAEQDLRLLISDSQKIAILLDLPDDKRKWLYDSQHKNLDLVSWLAETLAHFFREKLAFPLPGELSLNPPDSLLAKNPDLRLAPIRVPVRNPALSINPGELLIQVEPGAVEDLRK